MRAAKRELSAFGTTTVTTLFRIMHARGAIPASWDLALFLAAGYTNREQRVPPRALRLLGGPAEAEGLTESKCCVCWVERRSRVLGHHGEVALGAW